MSEVTTYGWTIDQDLAGYARHGYKGIEVWLNKVARNGAPYDQLPAGELSSSVVQELVRRLTSTGMRAVSVVCAGGLTAIDDYEWEARVEHFEFTIRFAAEIGASCVLVVPGDLHGMPRSAAVRRAARALTTVLPMAHRLEIDLAIEPLRSVHTDFVNTIPQALEVLEIVDDRRCGLCLDTYQLWRGEDDRAAVVQESAKPPHGHASCRWPIHRWSPARPRTEWSPGRGYYRWRQCWVSFLRPATTDGWPWRSCRGSCGPVTRTTCCGVAKQAWRPSSLTPSVWPTRPALGTASLASSPMAKPWHYAPGASLQAGGLPCAVPGGQTQRTATSAAVADKEGNSG